MRRPLLKKGDWLWNSIAALVLVVIGALIWLYLVGGFGNIAESTQSSAACRASVQGMALTSTLNPTNVGQLRCTTEYATIDTADVAAQKKAIADKMASCWGMFSEGKLKLFAPETGTYCVICSRLAFSHPATLKDFTGYLHDTPAVGTGMTYLQYLTNTGTEGNPLTYEGTDRSLDTTKPMAVVFVYTKNVNDWLGTYVGPGALIAGGALTLATGGAFGIVAGGLAAGTAFIAAPYFATQDYAALTVAYPYDDIKDLQCHPIEGKAGPLAFT
jgi:hypothetical protein